MAEDTYYRRMLKRGAVKLSYLVLCTCIGGGMEYIHAAHWLAVAIAFLLYVCGAEWLVRKLGLPKISKEANILAGADCNPHDGPCGSPTCVKFDPAYTKSKPKDDIL